MSPKWPFEEANLLNLKKRICCAMFQQSSCRSNLSCAVAIVADQHFITPIEIYLAKKASIAAATRSGASI